MSLSEIKFSEFPNDKIKRVIWLIGELCKYRHYNSTSPLINILLVKLDDKNKVTGSGELITIKVSELDVARIGTIWIGQVKTNELYYFDGQCNTRFSFNLFEKTKADIETTDFTHKISSNNNYFAIPPYIYPIFKHLPKNKEETDQFIEHRITILKSNNNIDVYIPAFELFTSTYAFEHKQIRNDLISNSMLDVVNNYIEYKTVQDDIFYIKLREPKTISNTMFLAHLAMNIDARKRISSISSALQSSKTNIDIYPYHTGKMTIDCDGIWLDKEKTRFLVLRITSCFPPNEYKVRLIKEVIDTTQQEEKPDLPEKKHHQPQKPKHANLPISSSSDPHKLQGITHNFSDVKLMDEEPNFDVQYETNDIIVDIKDLTSLPDEEIEELSSGEPFYGKESKKIGQLKSEPKKINYNTVDSSLFLSKVRKALQGKHFREHFSNIEYYDEHMRASDLCILGNLNNRAFLLTKITDNLGRSAFLLEFDRGYKLNDSKGLLFNTSNTTLSKSRLSKILKLISQNEFRYIRKIETVGNNLNNKRKYRKLSLPVKKMRPFNHPTADKRVFEEKYISVLTSPKSKGIFSL